MKFVYSFVFLTLTLFSKSYGQFQIGHTTITFIDSSRGNRAVETEIYYPANFNGTDVQAAAGSFPVFVYGHGFAMGVNAYQVVWENLVPEGYIVAFPTTESSLFSVNHQAFGFDLQFLVSALQNENNKSGSLLENRVVPSFAIGGHSMGGGAAFLAADSLQNNAQVKTLVTFAPAESTTNGVSSISSASQVSVPSVVFSGTADGVTPPNDHHIPMYNALSSNCKTIVNITGGAHCYFANSNFNCDFGESGTSNGITVTRTEQQTTTYSLLIPWLNYTLKDSCSGFDSFFNDLDQSTSTTFTSTCDYQKPNVLINQNVLYTNAVSTNYQWYRNDSLLAGSTADTLLLTTPGSYIVSVTKNNGCNVFSDPYHYLTTGLYQMEIGNFKLFPNPSQNILHIESEKAVDLKEAQLFSSTGQKQKIILVDQQSIAVSHLKKGIYFIRLHNQTYSFIKE